MQPLLRIRGPVAALLAADAVSAIGTAMSLLALPWLAMEVAGAWAGPAVLVAEALPAVLGGRVAKALIQRWSPMAVLVLADAVRCVALSVLALAALAGEVSLPVILGVAVVAGVWVVPHHAAQRTLANGLCRDEAEVARVGGIMASIGHGSAIVGPVIAAAVIAGAGPGAAVAVDAATYGIAAALILWRQPRADRAAADEPLVVRRERLPERIRALVVMVVAVDVSAATVVAALIPAKVHADGGAAGGAAMALILFGAAGILTACVMAFMPARAARALTPAVVLVVTGCAVVAVPVEHFATAAAAALIGTGASAIGLTAHILIARESPDVQYAAQAQLAQWVTVAVVAGYMGAGAAVAAGVAWLIGPLLCLLLAVAYQWARPRMSGGPHASDRLLEPVAEDRPAA